MVEQSFPIPLAFQRCSPFVNVWKDVSKEGVRKKMTDTMMPQTGKVLLTTRIAGASGTTTLKNQSNFAASRKRSGSGGASSANIGKDSGMVGNSNTPLMYTSNVSATVRSSRPRNTSWMMKNKKKKSLKRSSRPSDSASNMFASKKGEDIFADVGIERRNISKQSTLRVQKRIELKGNVSSRFQDDSDSDVIGDAWGD